MKHLNLKIEDLNVFEAADIQVKGNRVQPDNPFEEFKKADIRQSIARRFETTVVHHPQQAAVRSETETLTFEELNAAANRVAHTLCPPANRLPGGVALLFGHDAPMVTALMGVLKAGGYYVPLDPGYPVGRLTYMLKDAAVSTLLTDRRHMELARSLTAGARQPIDIVDIDAIDPGTSRKNPDIAVGPGDPAYMLYTSGSSGRPKGVIQTHGNVLHFIRVYTNNLHIHHQDRLTLFSSYSFDAAVMDIFGALLNGAALYIFNIMKEGNFDRLPQWLDQQGLTIYHSVPTLFRYFLEMLAAGPRREFRQLRLIVLGGEAVYRKDVEDYQRYFGPHCLFINGLGPTESTVTLQYFLDPGTDHIREAVPVGFPVEETEVLLLDEGGRESSVYSAGEIVYKSDYLAKGYVNMPERTARAFRPHPPGAAGSTFFSGDLGRRLEDGSIEFLGRSDLQVKIRGFRVEPGEIENRLLKHEDIRKAVVMARADETGTPYLCAYLIASRLLPLPQLREYLWQNLPEYMIPAHFVFLDTFPTTPTGKIDRSTLPPPEIEAEPDHSPLKNETEQKVAALWAEVLKVEPNRLGRDTNFFELGGNSLKIIRLARRIGQVFGREVAAVTLFEYPTIAALSYHLWQLAEEAAGPTAKSEVPAGEEGGEIAVIGLAGRFPGAETVDRFWDNLINGMEGIGYFSEGELIEAGVDARLLAAPDYVRANGILPDKDCFDAAFFGYTPAEAEIMDPQTRIFHECVWEALESAGVDPEAYDGLIGLFAGGGRSFDWEARTRLSGKSTAFGEWAATQYSYSGHLSTRISYNLNFRGPALTVQTTCSTSLVAVHLACRALLNRECDLALAGGVEVNPYLKTGYLYQEGIILSPDGRCRAFDDEAGGTVAGEGAGVVVLKRLAEAQAGRYFTRAVIKGSAMNNDGSLKVGFTAPGVVGQREVIAAALRAAGVEADTITYVEAHGTGTRLGDPVEIEALTRAYGTDKRGFCAIGSVKSNIGHLINAAGVAGLIKTVLALQHRLIPPTLHFNTPNREIDFDHSPFYVNTRLKEWQGDGLPRRAGVSAFGIGGTNAHVILQEAPDLTPPTPPEAGRPFQLLVWSARSEAALEQVTANLADYFGSRADIDLSDAAYTLQVGRRPFAQRRMLVCADVAEAVDILSSPGSERMGQGAVAKGEPKIIFMFPGQGSQYVNMGRELYEGEPLFRQEMDRCFEILRTLMPDDLKEMWLPGVNRDVGDADLRPLEQTEAAQPLLFVFEYALSRLLIHWGIRPAAMIGHSIGEFTAAHLAGVFSLEDALQLVVQRGRLMQSVPTGAMLSVPLPEEELTPLLNEHLSLAAVNTPGRCVISGGEEAIDDLAAQLRERGIDSRRLHTSHAFHSPLMEVIIPAFEEGVAAVRRSEPGIPYISNLSGTWITPREAVDPSYYGRHLRRTVRFSTGLSTLLAEPDAIFVEVGPGQALGSFTRQHPARTANQPVVNLVRHPKERASDLHVLLERLGRLWLKGVRPDWAAFWRDQPHRRIPLPAYPFERRRYSLLAGAMYVNISSRARQQGPVKKPEVSDWFYLPQWLRSLPAPPSAEEKQPLNHCLILTDEDGLAAAIAARLEEMGGETVMVKRGEGFAGSREDGFSLNPGQPADYQALFKALADNWCLPHQVIHLWSLSGHSHRSMEPGFYSLVYLARAIGRWCREQGVRLTVISTGMQEVVGGEALIPQSMTLLGPLRVIPQEYPGIRCRSIDVVVPPPGSAGREELIRQLVGELTAPRTETTIAFRGHHRWVETVTPVCLTEPARPHDWLRQRGVYLITGGLGGIGLVLAEYLARTVQARLILTGRTDPPPEKMQKIGQLEKMGAEVLTFRVDAADEAGMRQVVRQVEQQFGPINGVIHGAGIVGSGGSFPVEELEPAYCDHHFRAKIHGLLVLDRIFRQRKPDFCLLMSSLSSILGGLGLTAYAAANLFMDGFALMRKDSRQPTWISVNWDRWDLAAGQGSVPPGTSRLFEVSMTPGEGMEALSRIMAWRTAARVIVSTGDLESRLDQWIRLKSVEEEPSPQDEEDVPVVYSRPDLSIPYAAPGGQLEEILADIFQKFFGIDRVGIHDDFFELGGDSLKAMQIVARLERQGYKIPISQIFIYPTVRKLAGYIQLLDETEDAPIRQPQQAENHLGEQLGIDCRLVEYRIGQGGVPVFVLYVEDGAVGRTDEILSIIEERWEAAIQPRYVRALSGMPGSMVAVETGQPVEVGEKEFSALMGLKKL
jgi:polyketide synthase PksJ